MEPAAFSIHSVFTSQNLLSSMAVRHKHTKSDAFKTKTDSVDNIVSNSFTLSVASPLLNLPDVFGMWE